MYIICVLISVWTYIFTSSGYWEVEWLDIVSLCLVVWGIARLCFQDGCIVYISLASACYYLTLIRVILMAMKCISLWFWWKFFWHGSYVEHLFMCLLVICKFLELCLLELFAHFKLDSCLLFLRFMGLYILWIQALIKYINCTYFLLIQWVIVSLFNCVLWSSRFLTLVNLTFSFFPFISLAFGIISKNPFSDTMIYPYAFF